MPTRGNSRSIPFLPACLIACLLFAASACVTDDPVVDPLEPGDTGGSKRDVGHDAADTSDASNRPDVATCDDGFTFDQEGSCVDIDECADGTDDCSDSAVCTNQPGSFSCACLEGFTDPAGDGRQCVDVDECADGTHDCAPGTACNNTDGGWMCGACPEGYDDVNGDGTLCEDIDECAADTPPCDPLVSCTNTDGGFACGACPTGYRDVVGNGTSCEDIDECADDRHDCDPLVTCVNAVGGYSCSACPPGYTDVNGDGTQCEDIDECAADTASCDPLASCTNSAGGYLCACPSGYADVNGDGSDCQDVDECATNQNSCDALAECTNIPGAYSCACPPGYLDVDGDGSDCQDVDECAGDNDCDAVATCTNTPGSYLCTCPPGYDSLNGGTTCQDIDECSTNRDNCDPLATCSNTVGGFTCTCPQGYTDPNGDGSVCQKIPVCGDGVLDTGEGCDDGQANSDVASDACRTDCRVAFCGDGVVDSGEGCDDGDDDATDGCDNSCVISCVDGGGSIGCGGVVSATSNGAGSTDLIDTWACGGTITSHTGHEMVYRFVPDGSGPVVVELTGLSADLDLIVVEAIAGACAYDDNSACVGASTESMTIPERVEFDAVAGTTYFIIVDGWGGATSPFTLSAGAGRDQLHLNEVFGGTPDDYIEVINRSGCALPLDGFTVAQEGECDLGGADVFTFGPTHVAAAGGVFRVVDSNVGLAANEVYSGSNFCDDQTAGDGYALLCDGPCDVDTAAGETCANVIDALVRTFDEASKAPSCVDFSPPFDTTGMTALQSVQRQAFTGSATTSWTAADWAAGVSTRN